MMNKLHSLIESSYRTYYGKLFAALFSQFGGNHVNQIEDAIQNAFYKSLKSWKPHKVPDNKENWLFIVARNDLINQIKKEGKTQNQSAFWEEATTSVVQEDLRLQAILFFAHQPKISAQAKVLFILKNIFGLSIKEISESTLLSQDAIYKSIKRAKDKFQQVSARKTLEDIFEILSESEISLVEEILYAVFNIGFDSFNEKIKYIVNEDLCLEALAHAKLLLKKYGRDATKSLLALFCFHLARIPAKIQEGNLVPFFKQEKNRWNQSFMEWGFHFLEKPQMLNKFYIEALITSKHMTSASIDQEHWQHIVKLYQLLIKLSNSPIVKLNVCFAMYKANQIADAWELLAQIEQDLPKDHVYYSLVKAHIIKEDNGIESESLISSVINTINQKIRKDYLMESRAINF